LIIYQETFLKPLISPLDPKSLVFILDNLKSEQIPFERPVKVHLFLTWISPVCKWNLSKKFLLIIFDIFFWRKINSNFLSTFLFLKSFKLLFFILLQNLL